MHAAIDGVFSSAAAANAVKGKIDEYARKEQSYPSTQELQCLEKDFLVDEIDLSKMQAIVICKLLGGPFANVGSAGSQAPLSAGSASLLNRPGDTTLFQPSSSALQ